MPRLYYDELYVSELTGLTFKQVREAEAAGTFPKRFPWDGTGGFWHVAEVDTWLAKHKPQP